MSIVYMMTLNNYFSTIERAIEFINKKNIQSSVFQFVPIIASPHYRDIKIVLGFRDYAHYVNVCAKLDLTPVSTDEFFGY